VCSSDLGGSVEELMQEVVTLALSRQFGQTRKIETTRIQAATIWCHSSNAL